MRWLSLSALLAPVALVAPILALAACEASKPASTVVVPTQPPAPPPPQVLAKPARDAGPPASALAPEPVDGPPPPAKQAIDPKRKVDGGGLLIGASKTELWLLLDGGYSVVIDRATGCAVEGYAEPAALEALRESKDTAVTEAEIARPEVTAAIRDVVGLGRRLGATAHPYLLDLVWSPDGRYVYFESWDFVYRSADGGRTFARVDDYYGSRLAMAADGKHLVYERCQSLQCPSCRRSYGPGCNSGREYVSLATDGASPPRALTSSQTHLLDMLPSGKVRFNRSDSSICVDTFDLAAASREGSACVPVPTAATGSWPMREWFSVSPSGKYGIVKWEEGRKNRVGAMALTYVVSLVEMATGKTLKTLTDVRGEVDDDGNMVLATASEGGGDHTYFYPRQGSRKLLGNDSFLAWHEKTAILGAHRVASLGARKCDLVKLVKTP